MKDHYLILGVTRDASPAQIREAYRQLAKRYHPDVAGPEHTAAFREIAEAYTALSDATGRSVHAEAARETASGPARRRAADARAPEPPIEPLSPYADPLRSPRLRRRVYRRILVVFGLVLALVTGCERRPADRWPPEVVDNFLRGCQSKASEAQCRCALARLQERFSLEEFQRLEREAAGGTVPQPLADAVQGCRAS